MTTSFRVDQIDHIELFVPDRYQAAEWYHKALGLEIVKDFEFWADDPRGPLMISSDGGSTKLALFTGEPRGERPVAGLKLIAFRVSGQGFLHFLRRLEELDVSDHTGQQVGSEDLRDHGKAFSIYFCDPWGHHLEVTTYDHAEVLKRRK